MNYFGKKIMVASLALCFPLFLQAQKISLKADNITVKSAIEKVKKQSGYSVVFSSADVNLKRRISLNLQNAALNDALRQILRGQSNLAYEIKNDIIVIRKRSSAERKNVVKDGDGNVSDVENIKGKVVDEHGEPVIGASVKAGRTSAMAVTDLNGEFSIKVPVGETLTFSYLGYEPKSVRADNSKPLHITMYEDQKLLDEVVVIGYGTQRKSDLTGGIVSIGKDKLDMVQSSNLMDRLVGQIPGLSITTGDASPGASQTLLIRGENSLSADNSPLVVLDGIPYNGSLSDLDPNIIESMTVLKDASAAAIYGSRGSNGVILIQTKKGKKGAPRVTYRGQIQLSQVQQKLDVMNGAEYIKFKQDIARLKDGWSGDELNPENILSASELINYKKGVTTDWQDLIFRNAFTHEHQIGISGGTENTSYMAAVSYLGQQGVVENSDMKRYNINLNVTQSLNNWLEIGVQTQFVQREYGGITPTIEHAVKQSPYGIFKDANGNYYEEPMDQSLIINPFANVNADQDKTSRNFFLNTFANIKMPINGLSIRTTFGYNYRSVFSGTYYGRDTRVGRTTNGSASISNENYWDYTWENLLKYEKEINRHHFDFTGLFSVQKTQTKKSSESAESFVNDDSSYHNIAAGEKNKKVGSSLRETAMLSYMLRLNYSFADKYLVTLTGRSDGYSAFGANNKYAFFPSVAVAWNIAQENFMENSQDWLDQLKLRVSYGSNGNQAISPYQTLDRLYLTQYIYGDGGSTANGVYLPNNGVGNPNLKWETTKTFNVGIDFSFFRGRLNGNIDMYLSNTKDLLMWRTVPIMNGYGTILDNIGQTRNKGIEISLNSVNIRNKDFEWGSNINFSLNRDKIVELRGDGKDDVTNKWFIGKPLRVFYDYDVVGIWQEGDKFTYINKNGKEEEIQKGAKPGSAKLRDVNGDGKINSEDKTIIGSKNPSFLLSMGNTLKYKNFYFSFLLNGTFNVTRELSEANIGSWSYNLYNYLSGISYWTPETPNAKYASPVYNNFDGHSYYKKFTYVQIKNIIFGYNFDSSLCKKIGLTALNVNLSVENPYTFCDVRSLLNYEASWSCAYPTARSYSLGVNITF